MLCKLAANQENGASRYYKVLKSGYIYDIRSIWVLESNGIHPQIKHLQDLKTRDEVKTDDNGGMSDNSEKAMNSINLMKQYKELALTARKVVHLFVRQAEVDWNRGREDSSR